MGIGTGQRFITAAIESCFRVLSRDNEVSIWWAPAHRGALGNEKADEYAKAVAEGNRPGDAVPNDYRWETSLSHMARVVAEARSRMTAQWTADRIGDPRREYRLPPGRGLRGKLLRRTPKSVAGRYYQLLTEHAAIGPYLKDKNGKADSDR